MVNDMSDSVSSKEMARNISKAVDQLADEIARRSIPDPDAHFSEWSAEAMQRRVKSNARDVLLDWMLGDFKLKHEPWPTRVGMGRDDG